MANPIRLSRTVPKVFSSSKVAPVARQKLENRHKKQKRDPREKPKPQLTKKPASKKRDVLATPSRRLPLKKVSQKVFRIKDADSSDRRQGNLINIHV